MVCHPSQPSHCRTGLYSGAVSVDGVTRRAVEKGTKAVILANSRAYTANEHSNNLRTNFVVENAMKRVFQQPQAFTLTENYYSTLPARPACPSRARARAPAPGSKSRCGGCSSFPVLNAIPIGRLTLLFLRL